MMLANLLAKIMYRGIAVYLLADGVRSLPNVGFFFETGPDISIQVVVMEALFLLTPFIAGLLLWFFADTLARWTVGGDADKAIEGKINPVILQSVFISSVGLIILMLGIIGFLSQLYSLYATHLVLIEGRQFDPDIQMNLIKDALEIFVGLWFVVGVRFWVRLMQRFQYFGLQNKK
jgi:hypothetical protein